MDKNTAKIDKNVTLFPAKNVSIYYLRTIVLRLKCKTLNLKKVDSIEYEFSHLYLVPVSHVQRALKLCQTQTSKLSQKYFHSAKLFVFTKINFLPLASSTK